MEVLAEQIDPGEIGLGRGPIECHAGPLKSRQEARVNCRPYPPQSRNGAICTRGSGVQYIRHNLPAENVTMMARIRIFSSECNIWKWWDAGSDITACEIQKRVER